MTQGLQTINKLSEAHIVQLCELYRQEWWTLKRKPDDVRKMLKHSDLVVGLVDTRDNLVGFTRVLSDFTFKALILDVIVARTWRERGLGKLLMETLLNAPELASVSDFELYCLPELESFYRHWGFQSQQDDLYFMRRVKKAKN